MNDANVLWENNPLLLVWKKGLCNTNTKLMLLAVASPKISLEEGIWMMDKGSKLIELPIVCVHSPSSLKYMTVLTLN